MENNERKNNRNVFYAIMGVATLVITLIGATFAYFVATTNSAANAITTGSTTISLKFDDNTATAATGAHKVTDGSGGELTTGIKDDLIPVDTTTTPAAFATGGYTDTNGAYKYAGAGQFDCRDANGNNICSVYSFAVTNPATVAQKVYPTFTVRENGFDNLKYAVFKGTPAQVAASVSGTSNGWIVNGDAVTTTTTKFGANAKTNGGVSFDKTIDNTNAVRKTVIADPGNLVISARYVGSAGSVESWLGSLVSGSHNSYDTVQKKIVTTAWDSDEITAISGNWNRLVQTLDPGESMTYTMIFWIEETYENQSAADMTKSFKADVSFTTEGNGTGVTGNLIFG